MHRGGSVIVIGKGGEEGYASQGYGGPVGRGCHDVHIRDLRTCTHAHLGFAELHIRDLRTCTYVLYIYITQ